MKHITPEMAGISSRDLLQMRTAGEYETRWLLGLEEPTLNLILGGGMGLLAIFLSGYDDLFKKSKDEEKL